jgi:hypothetical protein
MRPRVAIPVFAAAAVLAMVAIIVPDARTRAWQWLGHGTADAAPGLSPSGKVSGHPSLRMAQQVAPPRPLLMARPVTVNTSDFYAWALLDRQTGAISGSANYVSATNSTESMVKAWISADYLRRLGSQKPSQDRLNELSRMIRDSDDSAAEDIYRLDGLNAVIQRLISTCGLTETRWVDGWWSKTAVSARDAVRMGLCIADGRAAGPVWTGWLLGEMRQVRGEGRFGIIEALPADAAGLTAIKNGWTLLVADNTWRVNCLAIHDDWVLAVLTRYAGSQPLRHGADICKSVTQQLQNG